MTDMRNVFPLITSLFISAVGFVVIGVDVSIVGVGLLALDYLVILEYILLYQYYIANLDK